MTGLTPLSSLAAKAGLTRDSKTWIVAQLVALATIVLGPGVDLVGLGTWLGIHLSPAEDHWIIAIASCVMYFSGHMRTSPLAGAASVTPVAGGS